MAREPRVVAHLGRPETPEETAARKAESSRNYRGSQTFRNLVVALGVTLAVLVAIVLGVPRGEPAETPAVDVAAVAADVEDVYGHQALVPETPEDWRVNAAQVDAGPPTAWMIVYAPEGDGFLRLAQGFDADATWAAETLRGAAPSGVVTVDGVDWDAYEVSSDDDTVTYALGVQAGSDRVLLYGSASPETAARLAALLTDDIHALRSADPEGSGS